MIEQKKFKLWWYSWKAKKKNETTLSPGWALFGLGGDFVTAAGRGRCDEFPPPPPKAEKGPTWAPGEFNFFLASMNIDEYHRSFNFFCQHFREYHPKFKQ